jgi:glutathione S-transferase
MIRILGKASSINVRKVLWTCVEAGLEHDRQDYGSGFAPTDTSDFLVLNPNGLVPVIEDDLGVLWESNTICRYLTARAGRTDLLPADPRGRAVVEQWMDWQGTELNPSWRTAFLGLVRRDPAYVDPDRIAAGVSAWNMAMGILERRLAATGGRCRPGPLRKPLADDADAATRLSRHCRLPRPAPRTIRLSRAWRERHPIRFEDRRDLTRPIS